jgi:dTMP kinase
VGNEVLQVSRGKFITLEGVDGAGKTSHTQWVADALREKGHVVIETREPGGTPLGEALRSMLLAEPMDLETETLLMFAARREHIVKVVEPALQAGHWVVSDRFTDATYAYQGGGRGVSAARIKALEDWVQLGLQPDLTLVFDVPVEVAGERLARQAGARDRFETEGAAFFDRVRDVYLARAREFPQRLRIVDSTVAFDEVRKQLEVFVSGI